MSDSVFDELVDTDDYYAWLGLGKEATQEEIQNAFRKMSKIYHPDKHTSDDLKQKAEVLFHKIKRAHEVLSDPHKKAIYDTTGVKGLETEGWEIVARTKTAQEILEEFELLQKEREEKRLQQRTNPRGTLTVGVDATDVFDGENYGFNQRLLPHMEVSEMSITQSVECPLTTADTAVLSGTLSTRNGNGMGAVTANCRHILNHKSWAEVEMSAGNGIAFAARAFRTLWHRGYSTLSGSLQFTRNGYIRPNFNFMVAQQLSKHIQGRLTWSAGMSSAMNAVFVFDKDVHHFTASCQLGLQNCFALMHYSHNLTDHDAKLKFTLRASTFGLLAEYGCEKKITQFSYLGATVSLAVPAGVTLKIKLNRGSQIFNFPIHLSESLSPSAIFYATVTPVAVYLAVKHLLVQPYLAQQKQRDLKARKEANYQRTLAKKTEAKTAIELMKETVERSYQIEQAKSGLLIRKAVYGKLTGEESELECIDATVQLQALVKDSRLILAEGTLLSELPGFYDPCIGVAKQLSIRYEFRNEQHFGTFCDGDRILIPKEEHRCVNSAK